jgi:hypothetical protein
LSAPSGGIQAQQYLPARSQTVHQLLDGGVNRVTGFRDDDICSKSPFLLLCLIDLNETINTGTA